MIDVQALASAAGLEPSGSDYDRATGRWDEDTDLHIVGQDGVSLPFLRAFARAVLEEAALACGRVPVLFEDLPCGEGYRDDCERAVRALAPATVKKS
jgi:hypothetical protein